MSGYPRFAIPALLVAMAGCAISPTRDAPLEGSAQLALVTTASWEATTGMLRRFERGDGGAWEAVGEPAPVVVGRSGLGWGSGLHEVSGQGPMKQEGDGRAPAGAFLLTGTFGYAESGRGGLPYVRATSDLECVDDVNSAHYNRVLDRTEVDADWSSHEEMRRDDDLYRLGIIVDHNAARVPGDGSCIFLHIWSGPDSVTAGCTAMPAASLEEIAGWARIEDRPILVQLPQSEYERLRDPWALP